MLKGENGRGGKGGKLGFLDDAGSDNDGSDNDGFWECVFLVGDNDNGAVVGRVFAENGRELPGNLFYADGVSDSQPKLEICGPRCGARYNITRELLEVFVRKNRCSRSDRAGAATT